MKTPLRYVALLTAPCLAAAALSLGASPAGADPASPTDTVVPSADAFTNSAHASFAYGKAPDLRVGNASGGVKTSYLHFEVPSADAGRVTAATLVLTRTNHHLPAMTLTASRIGSPWTEAAVTSATAPSLGSTLDSATADPTMSSVSFDVTDAVRPSGVDVAVSSSTAQGVAMFRSREATTGAPTLVLTLAPVTTPDPTPTPTPSPTCSVSALLVSSCQVWLGDAPQSHYVGYSTQTQRLAQDETFTGRRFDILHQYQVNGTLFPNAETIGLAMQGGRLLYENWKPATDMTWAKVAAGGADNRIDAEAAYLRNNFNQPFFLAIYHEPEDNVVSTPGSGMTTADYVAMYRHVVLRLRADGVTNAVTVMNYMGYYRWDPMRNALYPGDDVVDWIAWDPYMYAPSAAAGHDFAALVNTAHGTSPGFYDWATTTHPDKPLMLGEFGAFDNNLAANPNGPAQFYSTVASELPQFPALKALNYFTMNPLDVGYGKATQPTETVSGLAAWQSLAQASVFNGPSINYLNGAIVTQ